MAHEKILFLGPEDFSLITWLREQGEQVIQSADKLSAQAVANQGFSFLVSTAIDIFFVKTFLIFSQIRQSIFIFPTFRGIVALTQTSGVS